MAEEAPEAPKNQETKLELYLLQINIYRGEKLAAADLNGKSDPYCKIIGNKQFFKTKIIEKNLNPEWNEETQFCFLEPVKEIRFEVWDWDKLTKGDRIGNVTLEVAEFFKPGHPGFTGALQLRDIRTGSIHVKVIGRAIKPSELEERIVALEQLTQKNAASITSNTHTIDTKTQEHTNLTHQNHSLTTDKNNLLSDEQKLNGEVANLKSANQQLTRDVDMLSSDIEKLREQVENKKKDIKTCEGDLDRARQERDGLENEKKTKEKDVQSYKSQLQDKQNKITQLQNELKQAKA